MIDKVIHKIYSSIKHACFDLQYVIFGCADKKQNGACTILVYHGVVEKKPRKYNDRFVSCSQLESHIIHYKKHFNIVSFSDLLAGKLDATKHNVVLSFDDGYENNLRFALPILKEYNVPALYCITPYVGKENEVLWPDCLDITANEFELCIKHNGQSFVPKKKKPWGRKAYLDSSASPLKTILKTASKDEIRNVCLQIYESLKREEMLPFSAYWQRMNNSDIKQLSNEPLIEIASHGIEHHNMNVLDQSDLDYEMETSKSILEEYGSRKVETFAFPFGLYSQEVIEAAHRSNYKYLLGADESKGNTNGIYARMTINPYLSSPNLIKKILEHGS